MHWRRVRVLVDGLAIHKARRGPAAYLEATCETRGEAQRLRFEQNAEAREERAFRRYMGGGA